MLFTAIAATVVMLPWAIDGLPGDDSDERPSSQAPQLAQQPLTGLGGGETVREIHQDTPFSMVALTADDLTGTSARVRAKKPDGSWGPWYEAEALEGVGDGSPRSARHRTGLRRPHHHRADRGHPPGRRRGDRAAARVPSAKPGLGYVPANVEQPFAQNINAVLISPPQAPVDGTCRCRRPSRPPACRPTSSAARSGAPTRRCGAGTPRTTTESGPASCTTPRAATTTHRRIRPGSSGRSTSTTPARWAGATSPTTRWSTSTARSSRAAPAAWTDRSRARHTGGFNRNTWGVAMIGNFDIVPPTPIQLRTTGRLLGWRLGIDHVDPRGTVVLTSAGGSFTKLPARCHPDAADDLHPPRRRQHRLPGQRRLRADGPASATSPRASTIRPGPRIWRSRCAAARSSPGGSRWAG